VLLLLLWMLLRVLLAGMLLLRVRRRVSVRMRVWIVRRRRVWTATIVSHVRSRRRNYLLLLALHWNLRACIGISTMDYCVRKKFTVPPPSIAAPGGGGMSGVDGQGVPTCVSGSALYTVRRNEGIWGEQRKRGGYIS
jgi:hypothetical protein